MIELYTARTPNGFKVSVTLEELGLPYSYKQLNLSALEQKEDWYLKINPNGRIPAIIDRAEEGFTVFESGAIMIYLADKAGRLLPTEKKARSRVLQWLMFQMGGVGPMMGQANVFYRYLEVKYQPAIDRYQNESRRLCDVIDKHLENSNWLADDYSIADIANWCWIRRYEWSGFSIDGLENLKRWLNSMERRRACIKGINIPPVLSPITDTETVKSDTYNSTVIT